MNTKRFVQKRCKIFGILGLASLASAAIIPYDGLRLQAADISDVSRSEPIQNAETTILNDEGYKYKSVRRLKYRKRRDVSEVANEYLPPAGEIATEAVADEQPEEGSQDSSVLGADGYEYKTVSRLKYRQRRDVSETVRRLKYRQRRDVSEVANEYLPPAEEAVTEAVAVEQPLEEPQDSAVLGADGYEYKTVRRLKYRQRRDVSEVANEYLPPAEETVIEAVAEEQPEEGAQESAVLGADGYEYKTVRRLKYRQRRDVSEVANEYLPPAEEAVTEAVADEQHLEEPQEDTILGADGYEYKTVRRLKYRQRRDVSEVANEYLPPAEETVTEAVADEQPEEGAQEDTILGADGYEYKTVRRLKYRHRQ
uniref:Fibrous sheath CABYR-binding protein n=1 Tax=Musca domestica TaxID=7370 RepID=A0A1I8NEP1_MUSDO